MNDGSLCDRPDGSLLDGIRTVDSPVLSSTNWTDPLLTRRRGSGPIRGMRCVAHRFAALVALVAVLACSSVGTCWLRLATTSGHDCCKQDSKMEAAQRPCGSTAASVPSIEVPAPAVWVAAVPALSPSVGAERPSAAAFPPAFRVLPPPQILRI